MMIQTLAVINVHVALRHRLNDELSEHKQHVQQEEHRHEDLHRLRVETVDDALRQCVRVLSRAERVKIARCFACANTVVGNAVATTVVDNHRIRVRHYIFIWRYGL